MTAAAADADACPRWAWLLPFALIFLLPFGRAAELGTLALVMLCATLLLRQPRVFATLPAARWALAIWACYELAALGSTLAAVAPARTWETVAAMLRYLPLLLGVAWVLRDAAQWRRLLRAVALLTLLWTLDAWMQALTGWSVRGHAMPHRLTGVFGAGDPKMGQVLAVLAPFLLALAQRWRGRVALTAAALLLLGPILLSGSRASWVTYAFVLAIFLWREAGSWRRFALWSAAAALLGVLALGAAWQTSTRFDARMQRTLLALKGSEHDINAALSGRLTIWADAGRMIVANPWTGVGVRGFRYAYPRYARPGDPFVNRAEDQGAYYAHQIVLEILSESGVLGLALWTLGTLLAWRMWRRAPTHARALAWPAGIAVLAAVFPFNTTLAFYSAWWGLLFWWLLALWIGALGTAPATDARAHPAAAIGARGARLSRPNTLAKPPCPPSISSPRSTSTS
ncbi:O-antigen ligase family protein [Metallibacterium sp.]|uniref:O-antigen ligase family protein n=1 Tax=Metallibacterium sp. TaxID=2940281 RepID=UPI002629664D|nr:O-antigen ligase family protein [Metallibacterium sp.]